MELGFKIFVIVIWTLVFIFNTLRAKEDDYKVDYISYVFLWTCFMAAIINNSFFT